MFSDVIFDCLCEIEESLNPDYAYPEIYFPKEVIRMLEQMYYVQMLSDALLPDDSYTMSLEEMRKIAHKRAINVYNRNMKNK